MERARGRTGRPSRGDRWPVYTRLPRHVADRFQAEADRLNVSYNDLLATFAAEHYGLPLQPPLDVDREDELPLTA